jgi:hypothetical protein
MDAHFVFRLFRREILIYGTFYLPGFLQELRVVQVILTHEKYTGMKGGSMLTDVPARFTDFLNLNGTSGECRGNTIPNAPLPAHFKVAKWGERKETRESDGGEEP